jgi:hypothetical protein
MVDVMGSTERKMRHCAYCGAELGEMTRAEWEPTDTCGKHECEREMAAARQQEREEAHERLDKDLGY